MSNLFSRYTHWLHSRWPAGTVEKLPEVGEDGATSIPGVRIVGDLTGVPLLKFSADTGARAVQAIAREGLKPTTRGNAASHSDAAAGHSDAAVVDIAIIGGGVSGLSAALEATKVGYSFDLFEATQPFSTIVNFPKAKPIYTYPTEMTPAGQLHLSATLKEELLIELETQRIAGGIETKRVRIERLERRGDEIVLHHEGGGESRARRVIVAIGRTGNYRKLNVPGEDQDKVYNRLYDPKEHAGKNALVVGGGDSALESAIALTVSGAHVTLSYRKPEFARSKPENAEKVRQLVLDPAQEMAVESPSSERVNTSASSQHRGKGAPGSLRLMLGSRVTAITPGAVTLKDQSGKDVTIPNDVVLAMIGREAPLDFFRRSKMRIRGEMSTLQWTVFGAFFAVMLLVYIWKAWWIGHTGIFAIGQGWGLGPDTILGTIANSSKSPGFWYTAAYSACIVAFGIARIRRRKTPYVKWQTLSLMAIQLVPLFIIPEILLPWMDANHWLPAVIRDNLVPNGEYWRAYGLILAWPLFLVNLASPHPMTWWLVIGLVQTFVVIPLLVWKYGKGAYCGWICSCGALAETMGDTHRTKMFHGPRWNRGNMVGQVILGLAALLTILNMLAWMPAMHLALEPLVHWMHKGYKAVVDILIGGAIGVGFYFWFSGRVWCRFACPLAALMHIYARFTRFRIFAEKKKCISCNVCTSVCHQGIDIMNFANKGLPMEDPECVRCSACVQSCPTGTLSFGHFGAAGEVVYDSLPASPVQMRERGSKH